MRFHKEGYRIIFIVVIILILIDFLFFYFLSDTEYLLYPLLFGSLLIFYIILQFFRIPNRQIIIAEDSVVSPADGKVVVIEKVKEHEYFKDERIQVSVFMSVWNVHMNWFPVSGLIKFFKYHEGKYLLARNPKSSHENERTTVVIKNNQGIEVLFRQIAGIVARRVKYYMKEGDTVMQSYECGFIKFGSRLDIFIPTDATLNVKIGDKVKGAQSVLAYL